MRNTIEKTGVNYVNLKSALDENKRVNHSCTHMIIKLAYYSEKKQEKEIRTCCESNGSLFIPLVQNKFGILNETEWNPSYGQDSGDRGKNFGIKAFIDIYNCVSDLEKNKSRKNGDSPYVGELLDNNFFLNILFFISKGEKSNIELNYLKVLTKTKKIEEIGTFNEIQDGFRKKYISRILDLSMQLKQQDLLINKSGYIGISSNVDFFKENEELIKELLIIGFQEDYGKHYL